MMPTDVLLSVVISVAGCLNPISSKVVLIGTADFAIERVAYGRNRIQFDVVIETKPFDVSEEMQHSRKDGFCYKRKNCLQK